jgi:hypothetical protein
MFIFVNIRMGFCRKNSTKVEKVVKSADKTAEKWARRVGQAAPDYEAGVKETDKDWSREYENASARMQAEITKALSEKRHIAGAKAVGHSGWQAKTLAKGPGRWTEGVSGATGDYQNAMSNVLSKIAAVKAEVDKMPDTTIDQRAEKARQYILKLHAAMKKS